jgi:two-component system nitrate/nitrite response regulator NarL
VLSAHPLVLDEFTRLLASCRVLPRLLDPGASPVAAAAEEPAPFPRARVYVVDAAAPRTFVRATLEQLRSAAPSAHLLVVAQKFSEAEAFAYLRLGVRGLLTYAAAHKQLSFAVAAVAAGGFWVPRAWLSRFVDAILGAGRPAPAVAGRARLSRREQQVLDALLQNLANKEIASQLNVTERTIKFHVSNVLAKFAVRRRADLILYFSQHNLSVR